MHDAKRENSAFSRPGIILKTRSCSRRSAGLVWKPTRLYAVAAAFSARSCTAAQDAPARTRVGEPDWLEGTMRSARAPGARDFLDRLARREELHDARSLFR